MSLAGKTFILNSSITVSTNFGAAKNGGDNTLFTCNNVSYNAFSATKLSSTTYAYYMNLSWSNIKTYQNGWQDEAYRTITFVADPTDYSTGFTELSQFEEWLGANATEVYDDNAETFTATDGKSYHFRDDRLPYVDGDDNGKVLMVSGGEWIADEQATFTGATGVTGGSDGLVPAPAAADDTKFLRGDGTWANGGRPMVILSYGNSTWSDFTTAYNNNVIVYCRASSGSNPATGSQTRMAFMAYVNDASSPTEVEFQYYRSVSTHSDSQQGDQVYVYKLNSSGTWSVTVRSAFTKIVAGTNLTSSYSNGVLTISGNYSVASTASDGLMSSTDKTLLGTLNNQVTTKTGTITMESGFTSSLFIEKSANVVTVNGYIQATNAYPNAATLVGNIASGYRPTNYVRAVAAISSAAYEPGDTGYIVFDTNGNVSIKAKAGNSYKFAYFSVSYCTT